MGTTVVNFSPELSAWIQHNLERGCVEQDLVKSMCTQGFQPGLAEGLIAAFVRARREGIAPPRDTLTLDGLDEADGGEYRYETPRMPAGPVIRTPDRDVAVLSRLARPCVAVLESVLSAEECEQLIALARPRLRPSTVVDPITGEDRAVEHRDSEGMFFRIEETPFIARIDQRISALMGMPVENGEGLQVLRYGPAAKTSPHFDFLVPGNQTNRDSLMRSGQRVSTLVAYLNEVEEGGETVFPEAGLSVLPRRGNAVYFEYCNSLRQVDPLSVHAGAAVLKGEKWALTKWMRERAFKPA